MLRYMNGHYITDTGPTTMYMLRRTVGRTPSLWTAPTHVGLFLSETTSGKCEQCIYIHTPYTFRVCIHLTCLYTPYTILRKHNTSLYPPILPYTSLYSPIPPYTPLYSPIPPYTPLYLPILPYTPLGPNSSPLAPPTGVFVSTSRTGYTMNSIPMYRKCFHR